MATASPEPPRSPGPPDGTDWRDQREARRRRQTEWLAQLASVAATRADRRIGAVGPDGVVLAPSRSTPGASHEVRVAGGAAIGCSCWPARTGRPCVHRAAVAVALWEREIGVDLGAVSLVALVAPLVEVYLEPRPGRRRAAGPGGEPDGLPEQPAERRIAW